MSRRDRSIFFHSFMYKDRGVNRTITRNDLIATYDYLVTRFERVHDQVATKIPPCSDTELVDEYTELKEVIQTESMAKVYLCAAGFGEYLSILAECEPRGEVPRWTKTAEYITADHLNWEPHTRPKCMTDYVLQIARLYKSNGEIELSRTLRIQLRQLERLWDAIERSADGAGGVEDVVGRDGPRKEPDVSDCKRDDWTATRSDPVEVHHYNSFGVARYDAPPPYSKS